MSCKPHFDQSRSRWTESVQRAIAAGDANQALDWMQNCATRLVMVMCLLMSSRIDVFNIVEGFEYSQVSPRSVIRVDRCSPVDSPTSAA